MVLSETTLGEIATFEMGQAPPGAECNTEGHGTLFVKAGEFGELYPERKEWTTKPLKFGKDGDVFICVVGATNGKLNLGIDCAIGRSVAAIRPNVGYDTRFIYYQLLPQVLNLRGASTGSAQGVINKKQLSEIPFVVAPLPEQRRIVAAIETQLGRLDAAVARLHAAKAQLKRYKQAVLKAAYDQFEKRPLEELASVITKGASPSWQGVKYVNDPDQTLFVTSENVREGFLDLAKPKYVENSFNELQRRSILKNGDVLLNIVGASIGRAAIYDRDDLANTNQAVCLIRTTEELENGFLCNYLNSEEAKTYYSRNQVDVARANLSLKDVRELPVPFAPIEDQRTFNEQLDERLAGANEMESALDAQLVHSTRLRQSVLKRAFEGRLV
jgi:restriction endonuclease S subunit